MTAPLQLVGRRFGRLIVLRRAENFGLTTGWLCLCDCGVEKPFRANSLVHGKTKSCGCLRSEILAVLRTTHAHCGSGAYASWAGMKYRCASAKCKCYKNYGGRGIRVCDRWDVFENFLEDMGERPDGTSIDRIDNDGNYEPGNCKWSTPLEQASNTRRWKVKA